MCLCDTNPNNVDQRDSHDVLIVYGAGEILGKTQRACTLFAEGFLFFCTAGYFQSVGH